MTLKDLLKNLKLREDMIKNIARSLILVVVAIAAISYIQKDRGKNIPALKIGDESSLLATHTVSSGEDLWSISEDYYSSGYNWIDIASENDLANPNVISEGQKLKIPRVAQRVLGTMPDLQEEQGQAANESQGAQSPNPETHKVESGDSLWKIAEARFKSGYNWVDIAKANSLPDPGLITEGQELIIPEVEAKTPTVKSAVQVAKIQGDMYKVTLGDNLWEIAVRAYGDGYKWPQIAQKNNLSNPDLIHPGQVLNIPR